MQHDNNETKKRRFFVSSTKVKIKIIIYQQINKSTPNKQHPEKNEPQITNLDRNSVLHERRYPYSTKPMKLFICLSNNK